MSSTSDKDFIIAIDVGTTLIHCDVYNRQAKVEGSGRGKVQLSFPQPGWVELDPDVLWGTFVSTVQDALKAANVSVSHIACIGISTFRASFITWDKETGKPYHDFILWQDCRTADDVKKWNDSITMKALNGGSKFLYTLSRKNRFKAGSVLKFSTISVPMRLHWALNNVPALKEGVASGKALFGTLDTWLLWKLTGGRVHVTEYSCASSTLLFDPYQNSWSGLVCGLLGIPMEILPPIKDTAGLFGSTDKELFGEELAITAVVADAQSAMFGQCCFDVGDAKCTIGTGAFFDVNTGSTPHASFAGFYPLVGWKIGSELVYLAEGSSRAAGTCIEWLKSIGLVADASETAALATSVADTGGAYFVPAFHGLSVPINDDKATALLIGIKADTQRAHIVRAVLESLSFVVRLLFDAMIDEVQCDLSDLHVDGGVTANEFLLQQMADVLQKPVRRPSNVNATGLGAAYLAGLGAGVWRSKDELRALHGAETIFRPIVPAGDRRQSDRLNAWLEALQRSRNWYGSRCFTRHAANPP